MMFASNLYDREGFYRSITGNSIQEVKEKILSLTNKNFIFSTLPFECPVKDSIPNVSLPDEWKEELKFLDKTNLE